jgi:GST-like protein
LVSFVKTTRNLVILAQFVHYTRSARTRQQYAIARMAKEVHRILTVLEEHLEGKTFIVGEEYSIADMCTLPWVNTFSR